ncbi:MAG: PASTA domain-containing protein [Erysipelotrichaceae bacterium]|nr:PASTA domain-containing protein [Erysipelotrichaceae bacterium]MDY5251898.1 PASTA domain-containing protein [Erysipelotrichaceae bacterium]
MGEKKDFLSSIAQEVADTKKGRTPTKKVMSFEDYNKQTPSRHDDNAILEDYPQTAKTANTSKNHASYQAEPTFEQPQYVEEEPVEEYEEYEEYENENYISQEEGFNAGDRPRSFEEEQLVKVEKKPVKIDKKTAIIASVIAVLAIIGIYFFFFAPKISLPDFTGKAKSELTTWLSQNGIQSSVVALSEEYSLEYDKDIVISQQQKAGKKIHKDTPLNFTISKGPDPDELIEFPDLKNMDYDSVTAWKNENKLLNTKINTVYNDNVPENAVIDYNLKNVAENNFTRGTNLTINISRGKAPAGQVTIDDLSGKTFEEVQTWAKNKKITLTKQEAYSDTIDIGKVISQSAASGTTIKEGEELIVVVSKGKAVIIPNLVGYDATMLEAWTSDPDNKVTVVKREKYSDQAQGTVISQSIPEGSQVDQGTVLELGISLYMPVLQTNSQEWYGKDYLSLVAKVDEWNGKGASIAAGAWEGEECNDTYSTPGQIIDYHCLDANGNQLPYESNGCARPLPLNAKISMKISTGGCTVAPPSSSDVTVPANVQSESDFRLWASQNGIKLSDTTEISNTEGCVLLSADWSKELANSSNCSFTGLSLKSNETYILKKFVKEPTPQPTSSSATTN